MTLRHSAIALSSLAFLACASKADTDGGSTVESGGTGQGSATAAGSDDSGSAAACESALSPDACVALIGCDFLFATEFVSTDGMCMALEADVGWCLDSPIGVSTAPSYWFHPGTGRVFGFSNSPSSEQAPDEWQPCECDGDSAPACDCDPQCVPAGEGSTG